MPKAHLVFTQSDVSVNTLPLVDFSRASHLDLFEQPGIRVFNSLKRPSPIPSGVFGTADILTACDEACGKVISSFGKKKWDYMWCEKK